MFNPNFPYKSICFCGPSSDEKALEGQEMNFQAVYAGAFQQQYAQQEATLSNINAQINPILSKGINQTGFSAEQLATYNTQAARPN